MKKDTCAIYLENNDKDFRNSNDLQISLNAFLAVMDFQMSLDRYDICI